MSFSKFVRMQAFGGDDSDGGSPKKNNVAAESSNLPIDFVQTRDPNVQLVEQPSKLKKANENPINEVEVSSVPPTGESYRSMGEILSAMDPVASLSASGLESSSEKLGGKVANSNLNGKRSTFWGRSNVSHYLLMHEHDQ